MPCNGTAVATAIINQNLTELFFGLTEEQRTSAIAALLQNQIPALASVQPEKLPFEYDRGVTDFGLKMGNFMIGIYRDGRVYVSQSRGARKEPAQNQIIQEAVSNLVAGLGGMILQQQIAAAIGNQARITGQQTAANGALVLSVEL